MASQYYCLVSGLPELSINLNKLSLSLLELKEHLLSELHPSHKEALKLLFVDYDHLNLINLLSSTDNYHDLANIPIEELKSGITRSQDLPDYMLSFIEAYRSNEAIYPDLSWENQLTTEGYRCRLRHGNRFLQKWFTFDLDLKNIVAALNCRKHKLSLTKELLPVEGEDNVYQTLIQKEHTKDFGLSRIFPQIQTLLELFEQEDIKSREWWLDELKWKILDDLTLLFDFTIEKILSYCIKFIIVNRWLSLDKQRGEVIFHRLIRDISSAYQIPAVLNKGLS
ncbi:MAG: DUF2764 domain-containing protein [Spirochaetota bacterium]|nr:DUF2764 domain-containing protein [Spirochaetota bacterium]